MHGASKQKFFLGRICYTSGKERSESDMTFRDNTRDKGEAGIPI
jgi:hypothetical protein